MFPLKADVSQRDLYGKFQKYIHLQNNSPLTTLCLDFTEFYYISTPQLHQILLDKLLQCSLSMQRGILKSLSMQVLCFCRSSYKTFFFCQKPNVSSNVKPWSKISVSAFHQQQIDDKLVVLFNNAWLSSDILCNFF